MGHHGWGGSPPADDDAARDRIIATAAALVERQGARKTTLSDVASAVGVTRQTVYRHFGTITEILGAVAITGAESFVDAMIQHLRDVGADEPGAAVVEGIVYCVSRVPAEPRLGLLLQTGDRAALGAGITDAEMVAYGSAMLRRFPVTWADAGIDESDLDGVAELIMRLLASLLENPVGVAADEAALRPWLERWIAPAFGPRRGERADRFPADGAG